MTITQKIRYYLIKEMFVRFTTKLLALYKKATNYVSFEKSPDKQIQAIHFGTFNHHIPWYIIQYYTINNAHSI